MTLRRRLIFSLVATLLALGGAEVVLRAAGAVVSARHRERTQSLAGEGELQIWALGDSYTFGIGADDPARDTWPVVVARRLEEATGRSAGVLNLATPGANSSEIVDAFEQRLGDTDPPDVVLLLAGVNNSRWLGQSGHFCLEEGSGAVADVAGALAGRLGGLRTYAVLRHLVLAQRPPRDADRACALVAQGFQHLDDGYPDRADAAFSEALTLNPASGWAHLGLGLADLRVARHGEAIGHIEDARTRGVDPPAMALAEGFSRRAHGDLDGASAIASRPHHGDLLPFGRILAAWVAHDRGRHADAVAAFQAVVDEGDREGAPGGPMVWALDGLGWARLATGDPAAAEAAFTRAITIGEQLHITPHLLGWPYVGRAVVNGQADPAGAQADLDAAARDSAAVAGAEAWRGWLAWAAADAAEARAALSRSRAVTPGLAAADALELALREADSTASPLVPTPMPTIAVQQWLDPADTRLVRADLQRASRLAASVGARLVLTTYPQPRGHPELADAAAAVAAQEGVLFVDPRPLFQEERDRRGSWDALLIADGHPTTTGYALLGGAVADALLAH